MLKQSYENNPDVQRWLQEQALDDLGARPPFEPTLLAWRRDRDWVLSSLRHFYEQELARLRAQLEGWLADI